MKKISVNKFVRIEVFFLIFLVITTPLAYVMYDTVDDGHKLRSINDEYELLIDALLWEYIVYDLNEIDLHIEEFIDQSDEFRRQYQLEDEFQVQQDSQISVHFRSRDLNHSIKFTEVGVTIYAQSPEQGEEFGEYSSEIFQLPAKSVKIEGYPTVYTGLGHDDMFISINVGNPDIELSILSGSVIGLLLIALIYLSMKVKLNEYSKNQ